MTVESSEHQVSAPTGEAVGGGGGPASGPSSCPVRRRRKRVKRILRRTLYVKLSILGLALLLGAGLYLRLAIGPISLQSFASRVGEAVADRIGPGWTVSLSGTTLELDGFEPAVRTSSLEIRDPRGALVLKSPFGVVSLDGLSLLGGTLKPRSVEFRDVQLRATVAADGSLSFTPVEAGASVAAGPGVGGASGAAPTTVASAAPSSRSALSAALASLIDPILAPDSIIGALDRATVSNARLTLVGANGRERVAFDRVDASFVRTSATTRNVSAALAGPRGAWRVGGEVDAGEGATRQAVFDAVDVPLEDALLLGGLSQFPGRSDLTLSARVSASLDGDRLTRFDGHAASSPGSVSLPGQPTLHVDRLSGAGSWDEAARQFTMTEFGLHDGATNVQLGGTVTSVPSGGDADWRFSVSGRDAVLAGATATDKPVQIDAIAASLTSGSGGTSLDRLALKGPALDVEGSGSFSPDDPTRVRGGMTVVGTGVRRLLALWPTSVNPPLRSYVSDNMQAGRIERLEMKIALDERDLANAMEARPVADAAIAIDARVSGGRLLALPGLPPMTGLSFVGHGTGTTVTVSADRAQMDLPDGRSVALSEGSFRNPDTHSPTVPADLQFRAAGGADALAALVRLPALREVGTLDVEPGQVHGRFDLRARLPILPGRPPNPADLPITIGGTIVDLALDKPLGRDKLEGGTFAVSYEAGALAARGEAKLSGIPSQISVRQSRGGPTELGVTLVLDDAARARRGLPQAPQLAGPVPVKITATTPPGARFMPRVEADLSRAAVDGLLFAWTKPAGRPAKLAFTVGETDTSLKDIALEAGSTQVRGSAVLGADGGVERADLTTLKLSPGDDMRAQVERAGGIYRVSLRGNVADARPVIRSLVSGPPASSTAKTKADGGDLDIDAAFSILTGNNDEALTGFTARASVRNRDLRALQLSGRFRAAPVEAQLLRGTAGNPVLAVQAGDAGAALRFLDVYRRMAGGRLRLEAALGDDSQSGRVVVEEFSLRDEPALRSVTAAQPVPSGTDDRATANLPQLDPSLVPFNRLAADFRRGGSRVDYKDVVMSGPQVGFTLSGFTDYARDRMDVTGTFVPAFGLNNALTHVPIVGLILGGGTSNEGIFAVNFRVSGTTTAPRTAVNPLSAVAPGILRKLFGWMPPDGEATTSATTPRRTEP